MPKIYTLYTMTNSSKKILPILQNGISSVTLTVLIVTLSQIEDTVRPMLFHHGVKLELDYSGLSERSRDVKRFSDNTYWFELERFSQRQGGKMKLGGVVGEATYEGEIGEFMPLLEFGRWAGAGKNSVFGLGQMDYVVCE